jgi:hypothetical protein
LLERALIWLKHAFPAATDDQMRDVGVMFPPSINNRSSAVVTFVWFGKRCS